MPERLRQQVIVIAAAVAVLFFRLGEARLWDRDEPRNAQCAVEMLERGDWVVPYFNHEIRTHKPVLLYWLIMSAYTVFGVSEFSARFWSAALGVATVWCTYHLGRRLFERDVGYWSALLLVPALMFNVASRAATPDASLIFLVTATLLLFVTFAYPENMSEQFAIRFPSGWGPAMLIFAAMGLAVLAKGPVGFVVPLTIIVLVLWWHEWLWADYRNASSTDLGGVAWWRRLMHSCASSRLLNLIWQVKPILGLVTIIAVAGPWYAWVGVRTDGEFLRGFFWDHNIRRATEALEGHGGSPLWFYPTAIMIGFFPASVFLLPTLLHAWHSWWRERQVPGLLFCFAWIGVVVGLFSLVGTKLPSYVTPCYPALALLVGYTANSWMTGQLLTSPRWIYVSLSTLAALGIGLAPVLYFVTNVYLPGAEWLSAIGLALVVGGCAGLFVAIWGQSPRWSIGMATGSALLFTSFLFGFGTVEADARQQNHILLNAIREQSTKPEVASWKCLEPSWVFYLQTPVLELPTGIGSKPNMGDAELLSQYLLAGRDRFLIIRQKDYQALQGSLPRDVTVLAEASFFLKEDRLILLGSDNTARTARRRDSSSLTP